MKISNKSILSRIVAVCGQSHLVLCSSGLRTEPYARLWCTAAIIPVPISWWEHEALQSQEVKGDKRLKNNRGNDPFVATEVMFPKMILFFSLLPLSHPFLLQKPPFKLTPGLLEIWGPQVSCDSAFIEDGRTVHLIILPWPLHWELRGSIQHEAKSSWLGECRKPLWSFPKERCSHMDPGAEAAMGLPIPLMKKKKRQ